MASPMPPLDVRNGLTHLKEQYRKYISKRDYTYFDMYTPEDQQHVIDEAKQNLQSANVKQISNTLGSKTEFLAILSHVWIATHFFLSWPV